MKFTSIIRNSFLLALAALSLTACVTEATIVPGGNSQWVPGHYNRFGVWIPGHSMPRNAPSSGGVWVNGHYNRFGGWVPGHWR